MACALESQSLLGVLCSHSVSSVGFLSSGMSARVHVSQLLLISISEDHKVASYYDIKYPAHKTEDIEDVSSSEKVALNLIGLPLSTRQSTTNKMINQV